MTRPVTPNAAITKFVRRETDKANNSLLGGSGSKLVRYATQRTERGRKLNARRNLARENWSIARQIKTQDKNPSQYHARWDMPAMFSEYNPTTGAHVAGHYAPHTSRAMWTMHVPFQSSIKNDARMITTCSSLTETSAAIDAKYTIGGARYLINNCVSDTTFWCKSAQPLEITVYRCKVRTEKITPSISEQDLWVQRATSVNFTNLIRYNFSASAAVPLNRMNGTSSIMTELGSGWRDRVNPSNEAIPLLASGQFDWSAVSPLLTPYMSPDFCQTSLIMKEETFVLAPEEKKVLRCTSQKMNQWDMEELIDSVQVINGVTYNPLTSICGNIQGQLMVTEPAVTEFWLIKQQVAQGRRANGNNAESGAYVPFDVPPRYDQNPNTNDNTRVIAAKFNRSTLHLVEEVHASSGHLEPQAKISQDICIKDNMVADGTGINTSVGGNIYHRGPLPHVIGSTTGTTLGDGNVLRTIDTI